MKRSICALAALAVLSLVACTSGSGSTEATPSVSTPTVSASLPMLATFRPGRSHNDLGAVGTLMVHRGCIMLRSKSNPISTMLLWPARVSVASDGAGGWVILGRDGQKVAAVGDHVALGGDSLRPESATLVSRETIPEECMTRRIFEAWELVLGWAIPVTSPATQLAA